MCAKQREPAIQNISDTARWVAFYRAEESERPDAKFRDPFARTLAGEQGEQIVRSLCGGSRHTWAMVARTCVIDEMILNAIHRQGVDTVLNLAAGLDTRAYRMPLQASLRWIDVDLPNILTYREETLAKEKPSCKLESIRLDLRDITSRRELFAQVNASSKSVLVIAEGLLCYLTADEVSSLAKDLAAQPGIQRWVFDLFSPLLLKIAKSWWGQQLSAGNAEMHFAPKQGPTFFEQYGWKINEFRSILSEGQKLGREPAFGWPLRFLRFRMLQEAYGIVLLEKKV
jgi:methyltransferase (TIGR00027 family)